MRTSDQLVFVGMAVAFTGTFAFQQLGALQTLRFSPHSTTLWRFAKSRDELENIDGFTPKTDW